MAKKLFIALGIAALLSTESCMVMSEDIHLDTNTCIAVYPDGQADTIPVSAHWHITEKGCRCSVVGDDDEIHDRSKVEVDGFRGRVIVRESDCKVIYCITEKYIGIDGVSSLSNEYIY